ncbi:lysoplasmalogenase [Novosphingobium sp. MMS21-SN21R]|uniref:lysoplasmalogenase n=1 Tax=Novosphingobium sp. MMS21-SN21R TaxID=2969298 RepID=UPI0028846112|nr:lysoplasmalogenase [Novosphingobium sp. MMS21-SN21R]MDT0508098.1 lysoplasmalogenase [Novosphingobium sp. MMS21-SN21R]
MPKRALIEKRPWLVASLVAGVSYWLAAKGHVPGLWLILWKGAGVALLAAYAWAHHPSRNAHLLALVMALGAVGDMVLELSFTSGAVAFLFGHLVAIALYLKHRRDNPTGSQKAAAVTTLIGVPLIAWQLSRAPDVALYALSLAGMAAAAWMSSFPRYRVGLGAMLFVVSDLLIFARMGPLAGSVIPDLLIWPLYYFGQFLICTGVIKTLRARGEFGAG